VPYALDLEDFHTAETGDTPGARFDHTLAERVERAVLPGALFLSAASGPIASAYRAKYGHAPIAIHNTFPLPDGAPDLAPGGGEGLRLYWFSQTIGAGRGLEDAVRAMGLAALPGQLHVRGSAVAPYLDGLRRLAVAVAPALEIVHHEPASPDAMVDLCRAYDAGLSLEQPGVPNRDLCVTNKVFTYMLAGLPVVLTATSGQQPIAADLDEGALLYAPGDVAMLAKGLRRWADDRALLGRARRASWEAARRRWHWEHPEERGALLAAVARALA
jgi:glycosyltransferase involved in cell wall biosynthesis